MNWEVYSSGSQTRVEGTQSTLRVFVQRSCPGCCCRRNALQSMYHVRFEPTVTTLLNRLQALQVSGTARLLLANSYDWCACWERRKFPTLACDVSLRLFSLLLSVNIINLITERKLRSSSFSFCVTANCCQISSKKRKCLIDRFLPGSKWRNGTLVNRSSLKNVCVAFMSSLITKPPLIRCGWTEKTSSKVAGRRFRYCRTFRGDARFLYSQMSTEARKVRFRQRKIQA